MDTPKKSEDAIRNPASVVPALVALNIALIGLVVVLAVMLVRRDSHEVVEIIQAAPAAPAAVAPPKAVAAKSPADAADVAAPAASAAAKPKSPEEGKTPKDPAIIATIQNGAEFDVVLTDKDKFNANNAFCRIGGFAVIVENAQPGADTVKIRIKDRQEKKAFAELVK